MKFKTLVAVTEKGAVKAEARKQLVNWFKKDPAKAMGKAEAVDGKNAFCIPVEDAEGNIVYINVDVTVSTKNPSMRADKKPKAKAEADNGVIEID